jgi:hypothetical protein
VEEEGGVKATNEAKPSPHDEDSPFYLTQASGLGLMIVPEPVKKTQQYNKAGERQRSRNVPEKSTAKSPPHFARRHRDPEFRSS